VSSSKDLRDVLRDLLVKDEVNVSQVWALINWYFLDFSPTLWEQAGQHFKARRLRHTGPIRSVAQVLRIRGVLPLEDQEDEFEQELEFVDPGFEREFDREVAKAESILDELETENLYYGWNWLIQLAECVLLHSLVPVAEVFDEDGIPPLVDLPELRFGFFSQIFEDLCVSLLPLWVPAALNASVDVRRRASAFVLASGGSQDEADAAWDGAELEAIRAAGGALIVALSGREREIVDAANASVSRLMSALHVPWVGDLLASSSFRDVPYVAGND